MWDLSSHVVLERDYCAYSILGHFWGLESTLNPSLFRGAHKALARSGRSLSVSTISPHRTQVLT